MDLGFFGIIDAVLVLLGILVLVFGYKKGFMKKGITIIAGFVIFGLCISLTASFAELLINREIIYPSIYDTFHDKLQVVVNENPTASPKEIIAKALNCWDIIAGLIAKNIDATTAAEVPDAAAMKAATLCMRGIAFLILFILFSIVVGVLLIIANTLRKATIVRFIDGILGMAFYGLIYILIVSLLMVILKVLVDNTVLPDGAIKFIETDLQLGTNDFRLAKFLYNGNLFEMIRELF